MQWSVTSQQESMGQDASGRYVSGVNVSYTTNGGLSGTIFIPDAQYNAEAVKARIEARLRAMTDVHTLGGSL